MFEIHKSRHSQESYDPNKHFDTSQGVRHLQEFEVETWDALIETYDSRLRFDVIQSLRKYNLSTQNAEDVQQDVWLTALEKIQNFTWQGEGKLYHWLRTIAHRHILTLLNKNRNHHSELFVEDNETLDFLADTSPNSVANPEYMLLLKERINEVKDYLSERDFDILIRRFVLGESTSELALAYQLKAQSISVILVRAKRVLRQLE